MPIITQITEQKKRPNRRNIFIDGRFAFGVNLNVVAKFYLRAGMELSTAQIAEIEAGELRQECADKAFEYLGMRLHSRSDLHKKLIRREFGEAVVKSVLDELERLGYVDDSRFAKTKAQGAAEHKHHGRRRAFMELRKSGVSNDVANRALEEVYENTDSLAMARELAMKKAPSLARFDAVTAKRRLVGMLQRRGFDYETIKPIVDEALGMRDPNQ
jgi:regulatory protein